MKKIYCDFCRKDIKEEYQIVDWTHHKLDLELCKNCYNQLSKLIRKLKQHPKTGDKK